MFRLENAVCSDMGKSVLLTQTVPLGATVKQRKTDEAAYSKGG